MKAQLGSALLLVGFVLNGCGTSNPGADAGSDATMANDWVGSDQRIVPDLHPSDEMGQDTTSPPRPECQVMAPEVPLRRPVSTNEPMFIYNVYGAPETVGNLVELVPADLLPYFAVQIVPPEPYVDSPEFRAWIEAMVSAANEAKIPAFLQVEHMNTRNDLPQAFYEELFAKYSHFIGLSFAEISISGVAATALDDDYINRMKEAIVTASANGGYFLWQDMGYDVEGAAWEKTPQVFVKAGSDAGLFALMRAHATNLIFQDKHNGNGKRFTGPAAVLGLFTTCTIGQWGVNSEDWNWWEAGYGRLFAPWSGKPKAEAESWKSLFTFPEVLFGIDWLVGLSAGATVFAIEAPFHGFGPLDAATPSPAFEHEARFERR